MLLTAMMRKKMKWDISSAGDSFQAQTDLLADIAPLNGPSKTQLFED